MAAFSCDYTTGATPSIKAYAPSQTDLAIGTYSLYIYSIRTGFRKDNPGLTATFKNNFMNVLSPTTYDTTPACIVDKDIILTSGTVRKNWRFYNMPFNWDTPPYIVMTQTSTSQFTMLKLHFKTQTSIL